MKQHYKKTNKMVSSLATLALGLSIVTAANSSAGTFSSERQVDVEDRFQEAKPVAGRNRRRSNTVISVSDYPRANADNVRVSRQSNKLRINVLSNDRGYKLKLVGINSRSAGGARVSLRNDMAIYQIKPHFQGKDSFWYTMEDKTGRQHSARVIVCICDK